MHVLFLGAQHQQHVNLPMLMIISSDWRATGIRQCATIANPDFGLLSSCRASKLLAALVHC